MTKNIASENVLIVCRNSYDMRYLDRIKRQPGALYYIASDEVLVHENTISYPWIKGVRWLELMESCFDVYRDVIPLLNNVNQWLSGLEDSIWGIPRELLFWIQHCEGGMTTQRIQDAVLLIRSYEFLFASDHIDKIIIIRDQNRQWDDYVLQLTAGFHGISIQSIGTTINSSILKKKIKTIFRSVVRPVFHICRILQWKMLEKRSPDFLSNNVALQFCGNESKHLAHTIPVLKSIQEKNISGVALCWFGKIGARRIREEGLNAVNLETYIPFKETFFVYFRLLITWIKALQRKHTFFTSKSLYYHGIPLGILLWPSIGNSIFVDMTLRYWLMVSINTYLKKHEVVAIRPWSMHHAEGIIMLNSLRLRSKPLVFMYSYFHELFLHPYLTRKIDVDLLLALSPHHKLTLEQEGIPPEKIKICGHISWQNIGETKEQHTKSSSREALHVSDSHDLYILYDSNSVERGTITSREQAELTRCLLDFVKDKPSVGLIIKPHPSHKSGSLEIQIKNYGGDNVYLVDKASLPYHAINAADICITKFSTIGVEAMLFDVPVVSVVLDKEKMFRIFEDAAEYAESTQELQVLLGILTNNKTYFDQWKLEKQSLAHRFIKKHFWKSDVPPSRIAAEEILAILSSVKKNEN